MDKRNKGDETKNKIIECAAELFFKNGYNATGINEILKITNIPKGSFYFHFDSKKSLAIEVGLYYEKQLTEWISQYYKDNDGKNFIENFIGSMIEKAEKKEYYGCPLTTVGQELSFFEPEIAEHYKKSLQKLLYLFYKIFKEKGIDENKSKDLAQTAFIMYEGYLVYYRISKEINVLKKMKRDMSRLFNI